jgi:hypothetical protein
MVVEIFFWGNNLQGQLPTELVILSNLQVLSLMNNQIFGLVPTGLVGTFASLEDFWVYKFATMSSSELGTISLSCSVLQSISSMVL